MVPGGGSVSSPVLKTRNLLNFIGAQNAEHYRFAVFTHVLHSGFSLILPSALIRAWCSQPLTQSTPPTSRFRDNFLAEPLF
jgi:hypothetical protein